MIDYYYYTAVRYIPEWIPGMNFKRFAKVSKKAIQDMEDIPYRSVKHAVVSPNDKLVEHASRQPIGNRHC